MSYTEVHGVAVCTVDFKTVEEAAKSFIASITDENGVIDDYFFDDDLPTLEDAIEELKSYLSLHEDRLNINIHSEETNSNSELWDELINHFATVMTSTEMISLWTSFDSREGFSASVASTNRAQTSTSLLTI
jgi:transposase-like protein